jgi:hypothetical protein
MTLSNVTILKMKTEKPVLHTHTRTYKLEGGGGFGKKFLLSWGGAIM